MSPTPLAPTPPDDDVEAAVRAMLARRGDDVQLADLEPGLPSGTRIAIDDRGDPGRSHRGRARWVAVAAAVALVGAGIGLAARAADDGTTTTATDPSAPTTDAPRSDVFASFPEGVDPSVGQPLFVTGIHTAPEEAMAEALSSLGGEGSTAPLPTDHGLGADTWSSSYAPTGAVDADLWGAAADLDERGGVVVARPAAGGGLGVVAVTSGVIDLTGLVREGDLLKGEVRVSVRAPVRVVVSQARSDGQPPLEDQVTVAEIATTSTTEPGITGSVIDLGDPDAPGGLGVDVGDGPIVIRVEVGDAPGRVGIDGVEVAALATVGIPGDGGPGPDDTAMGATTTAPTTTTVDTPSTAGVDPGIAMRPLWQPADPAIDDPVEVAALFVDEVLGEVPASVGRPGASSGAAPTTSTTPRGGLVWVDVPLASGADLRLIVSEIDGRWSVIQVGDGGVEASTEGGATSVSGGPSGGSGDDSQLWVALRRDPATGAWTVERGRLPDEPVSFDGADAAVIAVVNDLGQVAAANGNALSAG